MKQSKWSTPSNMLLGFGSAIALGLAIALATGQLKFRFGPGQVVTTSEKLNSQGKIVETTRIITSQDAKTFWDWLSLLGVPLGLAVGGWLVQQQQRRNAEASQQEEILQTYFDSISALLVDKNLLAIATKGDKTTPEEKELLNVSVDIIRARTLAILRRLDKIHKSSLIWFLIEAEILSKLKLSLKGADLSGVNFWSANLSGVDLTNAYLLEAVFIQSNLSNAKLNGAYFRDANLIGADLSGADLRYASFRKAKGLSKKQLEEELPPLLCRTGLPTWIDMDPNRDCEQWEKQLPDRLQL